MKYILVIALILFGCQEAKKNTDAQKAEDQEIVEYLPKVGDSAIYVGTTRDKEMKVDREDLNSKMDTSYLDTVYADTVIVKRNMQPSIRNFIRVHYFLQNFPKDKFRKLYHDFYIMDSLKFKEFSKYESKEVGNIFYNDSLKTCVTDVDNYSGHYEMHKVFKGKKFTVRNN